jgi:predicted RNA binding protein YcfA (HicA-like mRNA interferase family)
VQFKNGKGTIITIPVHPGRNVGRGLLRKIIRDIELTRDEFMNLLGSV